jgi:hypothetical protein
MSVGQELLDVPLPDMVAKLGMGVADAQSGLDQNSLKTLEALTKADKIDVVTVINKTIAEDGTISFEEQTSQMTPFQLGLFPAFYQFSEATIEVTMDIKTTTSTETDVSVGAEVKGGFGLWSASVNTEVKHNRKFGKEVHGTSKLVTKMVPVPRPERIDPEIQTVDNRQPDEDEEE